MTFEEQLTEAFQTLTQRIRGEVDLEVQRRTAEIAAAMPAPAPESARADASQDVDASSAVRLRDAVRSIDAARSLTDILDALVAAAREEAASAEIWLSRGGRLHRWRSPGADDASQDTPSGSLVVPIAIAGSDVAFLYAEVGGDETPHLAQRTMNIELLTRYAARSLEALTAFKTARTLTRRAAPAAEPVPAVADEANSEEETSARRYARLLVSEIKLYHEPAVIEGRRDRDLATRLGGEIARARAMYEERIPAHVRGRSDYFHHELVRTLANGDAGLLEQKT